MNTTDDLALAVGLGIISAAFGIFIMIMHYCHSRRKTTAAAIGSRTDTGRRVVPLEDGLLVMEGKGMGMENLAAMATMAAISDLAKMAKDRRRMTEGEARDLSARYLRSHAFKPGDLVQWKEGLKNSKWPDYGEPVPVLEVVPGQRVGILEEGGGSRSGEPIDLRVGVFSPTGDWDAYWYNAARFEPYQPKRPLLPVDDTQPKGCGPGPVGEPGVPGVPGKREPQGEDDGADLGKHCPRGEPAPSAAPASVRKVNLDDLPF